MGLSKSDENIRFNRTYPHPIKSHHCRCHEDYWPFILYQREFEHCRWVYKCKSSSLSPKRKIYMDACVAGLYWRRFASCRSCNRCYNITGLQKMPKMSKSHNQVNLDSVAWSRREVVVVRPWTDSRWRRKSVWVWNAAADVDVGDSAALQRWHGNGMYPECLRRWVMRFDDWLNARLHRRHTYGFSPDDTNHKETYQLLATLFKHISDELSFPANIYASLDRWRIFLQHCRWKFSLEDTFTRRKKLYVSFCASLQRTGVGLCTRLIRFRLVGK